MINNTLNRLKLVTLLIVFLCMPNAWAVSVNGIALPAPEVTKNLIKTISMQEAVLLALRNNPAVLNAELDRVTDKFSLDVANNAFAFNPTLGASAGYDNINGYTHSLSSGATLNTPVGTKFTFGYLNNLTGGVGSPNFEIKQELLNGVGRYGDSESVALMQEINQQIINRLAFRDAVIDVVVGVVKTYRTLVSSYQQLVFFQKAYLQMKGTVRVLTG